MPALEREARLEGLVGAVVQPEVERLPPALALADGQLQPEQVVQRQVVLLHRVGRRPLAEAAAARLGRLRLVVLGAGHVKKVREEGLLVELRPHCE